jgi:hypothetical protein
MCEFCKSGLDNITNSTNSTNITNSNHVYKWYNHHVVLLKNNPELRLGIELFCLIGFAIWLIIAYLQHCKIIDFNDNYYKYIRVGITSFLMFYTVILFTYLDALNKLNNFVPL